MHFELTVVLWKKQMNKKQRINKTQKPFRVTSRSLKNAPRNTTMTKNDTMHFTLLVALWKKLMKQATQNRKQSQTKFRVTSRSLKNARQNATITANWHNAFRVDSRSLGKNK